MILNKLYKLKKKRGAVLFIVIAMMTLLVIMATAAYYTARGSYTTVIRNYDFSQVYMSAISVSDMLIDAVTNDTVEDSTGRNNYTALQNALIDDGFSKITAKSSKITSSMTNAEQILTQTANDPEIDGILDAVEVEITLESKDQPAYDITGKEMDGVNWAYYRFKTTAYYRGNTISIQDKVIREYGVTSNLPRFDTFFTATGERGDDDDRCVVISMKEITGKVYFENKYTVLEKSEDNPLRMGLTSSGHVLFEKTNINVTEDYNSWVINGSLILGQQGSNDLKFGNNDLVVGGDLIFLGNGGKTIYANNVYVLGDVYCLGGNLSVDGNLHVKGNIKYKAPEGSAADTVLDDFNIRYNDLVGGNFDFYNNRGEWGGGNVNVNNGVKDIGWTPSASDTVQLEPDGAATPISKDNVEKITNQSDYDHYTSKQKTLERVLTLDFDQDNYKPNNSYESTFTIDGYDAVVTYDKDAQKYTVELPYVPDGYVLDLNFDNAHTFYDIDYIIDSANEGNGKSLPIVLKPNYDRDDYTKKDEHGNDVKVKGFDNKYNAFCWNPVNATSNGGYTQVYTAQGSTVDVFFEVGNYIEGTDTLVPYSAASGMTTAQYFGNQKLLIGTYNQLEAIGHEPVDVISYGSVNPAIEAMYADSLLNNLKDDYQNQIMLISNAVDTIGIQMYEGDNILCGYMYAPFASYKNWGSIETVSVIGGMIVSDYAIHLNQYGYAKPDPELIEHLGSAMPSPDSTSASGPSIWYTQGDNNKNIGANFIG